MPSTLKFTDTLQIVSCWCGINHAIPADLYAHLLAQRDNGQAQTNVYCPLGHCWEISGKGQAQIERERREKVEREYEWMRQSRNAARDQADAAERRRRAAQGQVTKMRNRIKAGVCPVPGCKRTGLGEDVLAHIEAKHPTWHTEHPEAHCG